MMLQLKAVKKDGKINNFRLIKKNKIKRKLLGCGLKAQNLIRRSKRRQALLS